MIRYTFYPCDAGGVLPGEGRMEAEEDGGYIGFSEARSTVQKLLLYLKSDHVQKNKHRLGILGSQDLEMAIRGLESEFNLSTE